MAKLPKLCRALLFPKRCIYCGRVVGFAPVCSCAPQLERCRLSGPQALEKGMAHLLCGLAACYRYEDPVRRGIHRLKFSGATRFAKSYGAQMAQKVQKDLPQLCPDAVIPVPSTRREYRERGYDVPHLLAEEISRQLEIPLWDDILIKEFETSRQHDLSLEERKGNLVGAFGLKNADRLRGCTVLLCDDVMTSGATLAETAKTLKAGGAAEVWGVVFARAVRR